MARKRTLFVCNECGGDAAGWSGKCPHCGAWNTMLEEVVVKIPGKPLPRGLISHPVPLTEIPEVTGERLKTGIEEFDRVLGGGILKGSVNLIGGEPGIGKSTLMLQISSELAGRGEKVLYATGEESPEQVAQRAHRIISVQDNVIVLAATDLDTVLNYLVSTECSSVIIDSIQTLYSADLSSAPGSVSQVRHCTSELIRVCKTRCLTAFIVGHVTKTGSLAGPKVLEHLVDSVIYFEGEGDRVYRLLRASKNRFGSTNELGVFEMTKEGLRSVSEVSAYFLRRDNACRSGTVITAVMEGTRPFLVEVQALTSTTRYGYPQRSVNGMDSRRLPMLLAVLEKRCGMDLGNQDVYVNVAGGASLTYPGADLGVCLAVASSRLEKPVREGITVSSEIGLGGELRPVTHFDLRLRE
ncbi:MAG: DNA repair protein RadA, partial [Candidatus Aegiribacteria sp.]|nr:DNA repair protein RadA [Candidatus Aegiribacteria sp.]